MRSWPEPVCGKISTFAETFRLLAEKSGFATIIMVFGVALYIQLVPSENKKLGFVIDDGLEDKKEIVL